MLLTDSLAASSLDAALAAKRQELGANIRAVRLGRGFTQAQVALATGISRPTINKIEMGREDTSVSRLLKVAFALGVDADVFFKTRS